MSTPARSAGPSAAVVVAGVVAAFCFTLACVVAIVIAVPDGAVAGSLVALLLGSFGTLVPSLLALAKINDVGRTVDHLANGGGDAKMEAAVARALEKHNRS